jgi:hypothetical protein
VCHQKVPCSKEPHQIQSDMPVITFAGGPRRALWLVITLAGHERCLEPRAQQIFQVCQPKNAVAGGEGPA